VQKFYTHVLENEDLQMKRLNKSMKFLALSLQTQSVESNSTKRIDSRSLQTIRTEEKKREHFMKNFKNKALAISAQLALAALLTACGGDYRETSLAKPIGSPLYNGNNGGCVGIGCTTGVTGTTGTTTPVDPAFTASLTESFEITGAGGNYPEWTIPGPALLTDTTLKIRVLSGGAGQISPLPGQTVQYSNWSHNYYCVNYTIEVNGSRRETGLLAVGGGGTMCPSAASSKVIDFSDKMTPGHGPVTVKVVKAAYSLYCQWFQTGMMGYFIPYSQAWYYYNNQYCSTSMTPVYKTHTVTGTLEVEFDE
jgi:hypothetical protein